MLLPVDLDKNGLVFAELLSTNNVTGCSCERTITNSVEIQFWIKITFVEKFTEHKIVSKEKIRSKIVCTVGL